MECFSRMENFNEVSLIYKISIFFQQEEILNQYIIINLKQQITQLLICQHQMQDEQKIIKRPSTYPIFSKHLALQPMTVIDFANECKKHFDDFNEAFKKRIAIELEYAKNLDLVSRSLDKYIQPGTEKAISFICSAFKVENQQRAHQARQLAQSLRTEIYDICMNSAKQQTATVKRVEKDVKKYIKEFEGLEDSLERSLQNYQKVSQDMQQLIITKNFLKYTSQIPQQKKVKIIAKTLDNLKQRKQYQKLYLSSNRNYNEFVRQYNKCITEDLNQLQNNIREQIVLESDCMRKLIVCEVSMFKNIEYDLINISKQMEVLDMQKDVEALVEMYKDSVEGLIVSPEEFKKTMSPKEKRKSVMSDMSSTISVEDEALTQKFLTPKESQVDKTMISICLKHVEEEIFSGKLLNKKNKQFKDVIEARWNQLNISKQEEVKGQANVNGETKIEENSQIQHVQTKQSTSQQQSKNQTEQKSTEEQPQPQQLIPQPPPAQNSPLPQPPSMRQIFTQYFTSSPVSKQFLSTKKPEEHPQTISQIYQNFIIITRYINEIFLGQNPTLIQSKKKSQKSEMQSPFNHIKKLLGLSHFYRIIAYAYIQSFRIHHKVMIQGSDKVRQIAKFVVALLIKATKQNDIFILRGLLGLLFTFYWIDTNTKKLLYSQHSIYKASVWKKHDFWDSAIFQSTYEQMLSFGPQKGESLQQTILRQKNLIFSQLASYCHYMIMLGINSKNVRQIVGRYCRLYQMNDDQNRDLSKMITNTVKQYKEIVVAIVKDDDGKNNGSNKIEN